MYDNNLIIDYKKKKDKKYIYLTIICILLSIIMLAEMPFLLYYIHDNLKSSEVLTNNEETKVSLKYTDVSNKVQSGIYITDVSEVVEDTMPSIVAITSKTLVQTGRFGPFYFGYNQKQYSVGAGSGIIIKQTEDEIYILTNNHVIDGANELIVKFIDDKDADAKVVGTSLEKDIAIISVSISSLDDDTLETIRIASLGNSEDLKVGNGIIAIGNALGYGQSVTTGVISALNRTVSGDEYNNKMIQIDAAINGGNSGGALLNNKGEVIGINSAKYSTTSSSQSASIEGMGFAIPISDVEDLILKLMSSNNL